MYQKIHNFGFGGTGYVNEFGELNKIGDVLIMKLDFNKREMVFQNEGSDKTLVKPLHTGDNEYVFYFDIYAKPHHFEVEFY